MVNWGSLSNANGALNWCYCTIMMRFADYYIAMQIVSGVIKPDYFCDIALRPKFSPILPIHIHRYALFQHDALPSTSFLITKRTNLIWHAPCLVFVTIVSVVALLNLSFQLYLPGAETMLSNKLSIKKGLLALMGAAMLLVQVGSAMADQLQDIEKRGVLRVAVPQDFPPFGSVGTDLQPQGYDIDIARYLAKEMKLKLQLVPVTSANRVPYLQTNKVDLVISSLGKNAEREKVIDFSRAYAPFFLGVFGPKDSPLASSEALEGKSIGVTRGAVEDMVLTEIAPKAAQVKRYEDNNTTLSAYLSGQVEFVATGNLVVAAIAEQNPTKAPVAKFMLKDSPCYIGLKKGESALKAKVDALIEKAVQDNTLNSLSEKWLKAPLPDSIKA